MLIKLTPGASGKQILPYILYSKAFRVHTNIFEIKVLHAKLFLVRQSLLFAQTHNTHTPT